MKTRRAIVAIAPDRRQESFLARVLPSWKNYAFRHHLDIVIVRRSMTNGKHPYWDRWLATQDDVPETAGYDELLLLDNDIYLHEKAPSIFDEWDQSKVNVVEESAQGDWLSEDIPKYYQGFHVLPDDRLPRPAKVFNMGVCVIARQQNELFARLYKKWQEKILPRFSEEEKRRKDAFFRVEADGPFLSYELQAANSVSPLRKEFNFFIIPWLRANRVAEFPFLLRSKLGQRLQGKLPAPLLRMITSPARGALQRAASECHFLHVAASKSPLWLLPSINPSSPESHTIVS